MPHGLSAGSSYGHPDVSARHVLSIIQSCLLPPQVLAERRALLWWLVVLVLVVLLLLAHETTQTPKEPSCLHRHHPLVVIAALKNREEQKDDCGNPAQRQARQLLFCKMISTTSQCGIWKDIPSVPVVETLELGVITQTHISKPRASARNDKRNDIHHC